MNSNNVLIYGGGNCEIAALLEEELSAIKKLENSRLKLFTRAYILNNSCLAMYKRFESIRHTVKQTTSGGVYEYFYDGSEVTKTFEMKMRPATLEEFIDFLNAGIQKLKARHLILVLIGQGNLNGIFLDFLHNPPSYIAYEDLFEAIEACCKDKVDKINLIMDVPNWHNVYMPYLISRYKMIESIFVYEREAKLTVFPISKWLNVAFNKKYHWSEVTYNYFSGYKIDMHPIWWNICKNKWEIYVKFPSAKTWRDFYEVYKKIVVYNGMSKGIYSKGLRDNKVYPKRSATITDIKDYFKTEYLKDMYEEDIDKWLSELKTCAHYYKL